MSHDPLLQELKNCGSPDTLVAAILKHHPDWQAPVDVVALARRVGISACRDADTDGVRSALMTDMGKTTGIIESAPGLSSPRRRLTVAHQLGHFLMQSHMGDRQCTSRDLSESRRDTPRRKEEMQANRFAAALLMPKPWFIPFLDSLGKMSAAHLPKVAAAYGVTPQAAADRCVELAKGCHAILLIKDGVVRHVATARAFPALSLQAGDAAPEQARPTGTGNAAGWISVEARDWLIISRGDRTPAITMQLLAKDGGLTIALLSINVAAERRADEEAEKSATESPKFGRRSSR